MTIPRDQWEWYGSAGQLCVGPWCRFHLTTRVGAHLISTVGEYVPPSVRALGEKEEGDWMEKNWPGEDIGAGRKYETMVFAILGECACGCGLPTGDGKEIDSQRYKTAFEARAGHIRACEHWAQ